MDQLMEIIKYLKLEKAMLTIKVEVSQAEAIRLRAQMVSIQHQMAETQNALTVAQDKASQEMLLSAKYSQLLERVQTFPAMRDSNRVATEERDHFKTKLEEVSL
jgi:nucleoprotein TPR